jgi:energy-coupling factor transporter ATP-binding protein EcfA2
MLPMSQELLKTLISAFDPSAVAEEDTYVEINKERGRPKDIKHLANVITRASGPTYQLVTGHRGCGKTTEILALRRILRREGYLGIYCDIGQYVDTTDVEYLDILLALVQCIWETATEKKIDLNTKEFDGFFAVLSELLAKVTEGKIEKVEFNVSLVKVMGEIRNNKSNREIIRSKLKSKSASLISMIANFVKKAENKFIEESKGQSLLKKLSGIVLIVDNLDRLVQINPSERPPYERLFVDGMGFLNKISCHIIYIAPLALIHSKKTTDIMQSYEMPFVLPMLPVKNREGQLNANVVAKLKEILERRVKVAKMQIGEVFDGDEPIDRLCTVFGGDIRGFLSGITLAINWSEEIPINRATVESIINEYRNQFVRPLNQEDWAILKNVAKTKRLDCTEKELRLLDGRYILMYRDGTGDWYDVNPVILESGEFKDEVRG